MSENRVLRVLAVDDDMVCLTFLSCRLRQCGYKVIATNKATEALALMRENKDGFDIVITDVIMPEMDGFKLLEILRFEFNNIPVIMISSDNDTKTVVKGVKNGAQDYFVKPVKLDDLKTLSDHVIKRPQCDSQSRNYESESNQNPSPPNKDRKHSKRVIWTPELHRKFQDAIQRLRVNDGGKIIPSKLLKIMNDPNLSRGNIASHLQKYRNSLKKQKDQVTGQESSNLVGSSISAPIPNPSYPMTNFSNNTGQWDTSTSTGNTCTTSSRFFARTGLRTPCPAAKQDFGVLPLSTLDFPHPQNQLLQHSSQTMDQISSQLPERKSMVLQNVHPRRMMFNEYTDNSWVQQHPSSISSSIASHPSTQYHVGGIAPYAQSHNVFTSNYPISRGMPMQMNVQQAQCSLPGHLDVQNLRENNGSPIDVETEFAGNDPTQFTEFLQDMEIIDSIDDDLRAYFG
ncbi:hypothetical protein ACJIZ3_025324 [Penstemon smallii]|uniref:Response regulatory domain-containing protein n=1 Tax=Penstemon smallii TaxID=265156 RepID=A0ABD3TWT9_9LAMI